MGMFSGITSGLIATLQWLPYLIGLGLFIAVGIFAYVKWVMIPKQHPVIALLFERIGERPIYVGNDMAGQKKVGAGSIEYKLMKRKKERILPVSYNFLIPSKSGKLCVILMKIGDNAWIPMQVENMGDMLNFKPVEADMRNWHLQINQELIQKYKKPTWWQENRSAVLFIIAIMGTIVIYYMMWTYAPTTISASHSQAAAPSNNIVNAVTNTLNPSGVPI